MCNVSPLTYFFYHVVYSQQWTMVETIKKLIKSNVNAKQCNLFKIHYTHNTNTVVATHSIYECTFATN